MPMNRRFMAKLRFITSTCDNCGELVELKQISIKIFYSVTSDSTTIPVNFSRNKRTPGNFVFMLAGKCDCGATIYLDIDPKKIIEIAREIKMSSDEKGVEEGDIQLYSEEIVAQNKIM